MKSSHVLLLLSIAFSLIFLLSGPVVSQRAPIFKVGSILLLALPGFRADKLLGAALAFGALGDLLLGVHRLGPFAAEKLFLFGLGAFLLGHLIYIVMFRKYRARDARRLRPMRMLGVIAILIVLIAMLATLWNSLGPLLIPVVIYAVVLCGMGISAMLADLGNPLAAIGALSFIASDAMLAISKFRGPFAGHEPLVWITYYTAQLLILLGILKRRAKVPVHP